MIEPSEPSAAWRHCFAVVRPALLLAPRTYLHGVRDWLSAEGILAAVATNDTPVITPQQDVEVRSEPGNPAPGVGIDHDTAAFAVNAIRSWWTKMGCERYPSAGLTVRCELDEAIYPAGIKVSDADMAALHIIRDTFHGEWNYTINPDPIKMTV